MLNVNSRMYLYLQLDDYRDVANLNRLLEINPLVVIPNAEKTSAEVHFLDLAAKLDQTAEFECGAKWAIARSPAALGLRPTGSDKVSIDVGPPIDFPAPFGRELSKEEAYVKHITRPHLVG